MALKEIQDKLNAMFAGMGRKHLMNNDESKAFYDAFAGKLSSELKAPSLSGRFVWRIFWSVTRCLIF